MLPLRMLHVLVSSSLAMTKAFLGEHSPVISFWGCLTTRVLRKVKSFVTYEMCLDRGVQFSSDAALLEP
jgi:hypothetical protein